MTTQLAAAVLATAVVAAVLLLVRLVGVFNRRGLRGEKAAPGPAPYVLYFWGPGCTACRTHQEPALRRLRGVRVEKVDALEQPELARRFKVYTLPTTVVVGSDGTPLQVNYGYADAKKLRRQLEAASARQAGQAVA